VAPRLLSRSPVGLALVAWRVWKRLPPGTRRSLYRAARSHGLRLAGRHGPRLASRIVRLRGRPR